MSNRKELSYKEAVQMLPTDDYIHTFRQGVAGMLIGMDHRREDILEILERGPIELSGEMAAKLGHEIAVGTDEKGFLFVQTIGVS